MSNCGGCDEITLPLGQDGVDGENAFTITTSSFNQPVAGSPLSIQVSASGQYSNAWASVGQVIYIVDSSGNGGWYSVVSTTGTTTIEINNLGYPGSTADGLTIGSSASVSPSGPIGAAGAAGAAGTAGTAGSQGAAGLNGTTLKSSAPGNSTTSTSFATVTPTFTWTVGTDLLSQDNDKVVIDALFNNNIGSAKGLKGYFQVCMADTSINVISDYFYFSPGDLVIYPGSSSNVKIEVYRLSLTSVRTTVTYIDNWGNSKSWGLPSSLDFNIDLSLPISIYINGKLSTAPSSGEFVECVHCSVSSYKQQ